MFLLFGEDGLTLAVGRKSPFVGRAVSTQAEQLSGTIVKETHNADSASGPY